MGISSEIAGLDIALLELSKKFVFPSELREVSLRGLGVSADFVDRHIYDAQNNVSCAAYNLFREWSKSQSDTTIACNKMREALIKGGKPFFLQVP